MNFSNREKRWTVLTAPTTLHYTTLHYTTLRYTPLRYITLGYTTLNYITLTTLHATACITLHSTTRNYTTLRLRDRMLAKSHIQGIIPSTFFNDFQWFHFSFVMLHFCFMISIWFCYVFAMVSLHFLDVFLRLF